MATYENVEKVSVVGIIFGWILIIGTAYLIGKGINSITLASCNGKFPNPEIGGCGIYSENDLNRMKCEKANGIYMRGGLFSSANCVIP